MLRQFTAPNKPVELPAKHARSIPPLKHKHHQHELATPNRVLPDVDVTSIISLDSADEAVLRYVRELAKRLAREDLQADVLRRTSHDQSEAAE